MNRRHWQQRVVAAAVAAAVSMGFGGGQGVAPTPTDTTLSNQPPRLPPDAVVIGSDQPTLFVGNYFYTHLNHQLVRFTVGQKKPDRFLPVVGYTTIWKDKIITATLKNVYILDQNLKMLKTIPLKNYGVPLNLIDVNEKYMLITWRSLGSPCSAMTVYDFAQGKFLWSKASGYRCDKSLTDLTYDIFDSASFKGKYILTYEPSLEDNTYLLEQKTGKIIAFKKYNEITNSQVIEGKALWDKFKTLKFNDLSEYDYNFNYKYSQCKLKSKSGTYNSDTANYLCLKHNLFITLVGYGSGNYQSNITYFQYKERK